MKLGTALLRDRVIGLDQLEAALRAQVLYGGRLGTNLVELGHISLETLGDYLGATLGVPVATAERMRAASAEVLAMVPPDVAQAYQAFPMGHEGEGADRRLAVAFANPRDLAALAAIEEATGERVRGYVAPELLVQECLERAYGDAVVRAAIRVPEPTGAAGAGRPRTVRVQPLHVQPAPMAAPPPAPPPILSLREALTLLEAATERDPVGEAVLRFARGRADAAALFLVRDEHALGWRGFVGVRDAPAVRSLALRLGEPSCLASAFAGAAPWRGRLAPESSGPDGRILAALDTPRVPGVSVVMPIAVGSRVVSLVYAHGRTLGEGAADALASVCEAAGDAYLRLVEASRRR